MEIFSWLGYACALFSYLALLMLMSIANTGNQKSKLTHKSLILFTLSGVHWSIAYLTTNLSFSSNWWLNWAESLRIISIGLLLISLLNRKTTSYLSLIKKPSCIIIFSTAVIFPILAAYQLVSSAWFYIGYLAMTVALLILLEILFRQAKAALWGLKPIILAFGALLIYDFIVFSDASLIAHVDKDMWLARGYLHAFLAPLLLWSIKRSKTLGIQVYISREMVFQSSLLLSSGVYLCLMAITGYYIKSIESQWSSMIQVIFIVLAFVVLFALFISEGLKRNIRVFLEKNFFANRFDYRVQWLNLTNQLNTPLNSTQNFYDRSLDVLINSIQYDQGALYKLNNQQLECVATKNIVSHCHSRANKPILLKPVLDYIKQKHWVIDLKDYQQHPAKYPQLVIDKTLISECPFHVIVPIYQQEKLWGLVCLNNSAGDLLHFNWEIRDYMTVVTNQVGHYIFQHEANQVVTENAQFAAFSRMSAFVIHDLKNVLAQINMILSNAQKHKHNPEFIDDTFETLGYTKQRMEKMLAQLMNKTNDEQQIKNTVEITQLLSQLINERCSNLQPEPKIITEQTAELALDTEKFSNVLYHLIDNAQHATDDSGKVEISIETEPEVVRIIIKDTGCGMSTEFIRNKLFKPFETTKGNAGMGIGAHDAKLYIEQLGGVISVNSVESKGSEFIIELPNMPTTGEIQQGLY
ncbi:XrtA/PEP-CTERM system histidine kinase PrsK [Catenovulum adriaticum]|uniref:histidine kinase n=1 Tax=Catenovulum adriaticum TaxID=2984846 RepID=A0ABY7AN81_9ALTE|nr:XrtA/PEP-CTERM system histidine kinase PrsK [Catenovulum sp. TS8]WAJ70673.1 PEP-CTERM system histidine kinase PrsK [Catenovulum sp. TS8]